jgi:hypothetical protein
MPSKRAANRLSCAVSNDLKPLTRPTRNGEVYWPLIKTADKYTHMRFFYLAFLAEHLLFYQVVELFKDHLILV